MNTISTLWQLDTLVRTSDHLTNSTNEPLQLQNFIENQFLDCAHTPEWIDSPSPRSGKLLLKVPLSPPNVVDYAINVASRAFPAWSQTTPHERSDLLLRVASILEEKKDMFTVWESIDQGKTLFRARSEVDRSIEHFRYFAKYILHDESVVHLNKGTGDSTLTHEHRVPVGVYAIVTSSNMPLFLLTSKIAPCLAFGCTGVAKPSELTSMTAFLFGEVLRQAELPPGVMNIVFGNGTDTGSTLIGSPLVKGVSFCGAIETGIQIRKDTAADIHKHMSLEIRGSSPILVFGDVDVDEAVSAAAYAAFENSGQLCLGGSRIFVHKSIYRMFLLKFTRYVHSNYGLDKELGPIVFGEHYSKIRSHLVQAGEEHASVRTDSPVVQEEIFGPVATVLPFDTEEKAVKLCNNNSNGMGAVILTDDLARMSRVGEHLDAALVWGGCWLGRELGAGFSDIRATGTGQEGGTRSREIFTGLRAVHVPSY
ncbi:hypothetical protein DTO013E5_8617 [Penicillium roqueforti]|nr:hypothetical protein DTO012A1_8340 [Penicillium roqueforti]KAI2747144.1 hypothetical protein DTO013F2_6875 [Penicillium roqueforti]KAI2772348.1 hypothetical protein DTO012A8_3002 [Penicillium roqueforti]KAI3072549.1 hypothetical protein CBS147339_6687 [Penicillium roqueforti]KAI3090435.1 hypothetical protein CBS147338_8987 [Penicillium roqueforti]